MLVKNIVYLFVLPLLLGTFGCSRPPKSNKAKVHIEEKQGKFTLYKDGSPYYIKGASGYEHLELIKQAGGNTIRTWDTTRLDTILKKAGEQGLTVVVGLPMPESRFMYFYNDTAKTNAQFKAFKNIINTYKDHPALLMWCVGNELSFPHRPSYNNFYKAFNGIVDLIHEVDPNHPVTTTMVNFDRKYIFNLKLRTDIDIISFNIFGKLRSFKKDVDDFSWFWNGPYLITEWGIDGPWLGSSYTAWKGYIEPTSTKKAEEYVLRYKNSMPTDDPGFLGSFIFFWGYKQEVTHTWFSIFDEYGNKTESVSAAQEIWTGNKSSEVYPRIKSMIVDKKGAHDDILYKPGQIATAEILMEAGSAEPVKVEWEIYPEDWYKENNVDNIVRPKQIKTTFNSSGHLQVSFNVPANEGPYRIFAKVFNKEGNIATCNTPFYVAGNNE